MLSKDKIISIFCLIDDILQGIDHKDDIRRRVSDSEIILTDPDDSEWQELPFVHRQPAIRVV